MEQLSVPAASALDQGTPEHAAEASVRHSQQPEVSSSSGRHDSNAPSVSGGALSVLARKEFVVPITMILSSAALADYVYASSKAMGLPSIIAGGGLCAAFLVGKFFESRGTKE